MDPFANFKSKKPAYKIKIPFKIQQPPEFTQEPSTLSDYLRRRRLELGWYQKDVATKLGITASTICNWEHDWTIYSRYIPRVIESLGYNPIPRPDDVIERLAWCKRIKGLTFEELGAEMARDSEQLTDWLRGRHKPCERNLKEIERFLGANG